MATLLTGPQVAKLCGVKPPTVRSWVRRGYLTKAGLDARGRPLYTQLAAAKAERATAERAGRL
ncbi:helix-turn-helix domain-containing protein [Streptacidiphilus sp. N1-12]|uniref:Helix-turn-helix domain-containing protein n=2 Tax=Streptacidiphilus alkalitolerans TaxID=3342712 RepID=A0ABV6WEP0_9ACTN